MPGTKGIRAGRAYVEVGSDDSKLARGLRRAQRRLRAFGASVVSIGKRVALAGAMALGPLLAAAKVFSSAGDEVAKMAKRTGLSVEALSELKFVASQTGTEFSALENAFRKMQRSIYDAGRGLSTQTDALADLGLAFKHLDGLSPEDQFKLLADRISQVADPTRRAAIAMSIFGRSGTNLLPMFAQGAAGIEALQKEARRLGLTMSSVDAKAAEDFTDALDALWRVLKMGVFQIGAAVASALQPMAERITSVMAAAVAWIKQNRRLVVTLLAVTAGVVAGGIALVVLGGAIHVVSMALGAMATVVTTAVAAVKLLSVAIAALLSPIGLAVAGVAALAGAILHATGAAGRALGWLGDRFGELRDDAVSAYKGIAAAMAAGDIGLAAKILWLSLKVKWIEGTNVLLEKWLAFKSAFLGVIDDFVYGGQVIWAGFVHTVSSLWIELTASLRTIWTKFTSWHARTVEATANWMAKRLIEIMGILDKTIDVKFAIENVDEQSKKEFAKIKAQKASEMAEIEKSKGASLAKSDKEHLARLAEIVDADVGTTKKRKDEDTKELATAKEDLAKAIKALADTISSATAKREATARELSERTDTMAIRSPLSTTRGTFNAYAAAGMAGGGAVDKIAESTAIIARNSGKIERNTRSPAPAFN